MGRGIREPRKRTPDLETKIPTQSRFKQDKRIKEINLKRENSHFKPIP